MRIIIVGCGKVGSGVVLYAAEGGASFPQRVMS